jgi:hypothetical protein
MTPLGHLPVLRSRLKSLVGREEVSLAEPAALALLRYRGLLVHPPVNLASSTSSAPDTVPMLLLLLEVLKVLLDVGCPLLP